MTVVVPEPVPLEMPPGDVAALDALVVDVACAAYDLAVLSGRLVGPAAAAPGWVGDDASAAATQVTRLAALTQEWSTAVLTAAGRLSAHSDVLHDACRTTGRLRAEQDEDFSVVWSRLGHMGDLEAMQMTDAPELVALVADLEAAEAARRSRHAAVLAEVADDAASTARALADASRVVGGTGVAGDANRVVAHLAAALPGWGDAELDARGRALGSSMLDRPLTTVERETLAAAAAEFAGSRAFATGLLAALGRAGVAGLLRFIGLNEEGRIGPVARLLASALSAGRAAGRSGDSGHSGDNVDSVDEVLVTTGLTAADRNGDADLLARGMAAVLSAGTAAGHRLQSDVVVNWGRQLIACESAWAREVGSVALAGGGSPPPDPLTLVVRSLADERDTAAVLSLFGAPRAWDVLLGRFWSDGGAALSDAVDLVAAAPGESGGAVVRSGLVALGAGLSDGDPRDWTVRPRTAAAVAPALARAVAAHVDVATDALEVGIDGRLGGGRGDVLRGLGYVTLDRGAAAQVERALLAWARVQPRALDGMSSTGPLAAVAILSAYLAVEQYGQRLAYAMHGFDEQHAAEGRQALWNYTIGLVVDALPGWGGVVGGVAAGGLSILLRTDGTWANGPDRGLVFDRRDAANLVVRAVPGEAGVEAELGRQAAAAFSRSQAALGVPLPPASPDQDLQAPGLDAVSAHRRDLAESMARRLVGSVHPRVP